MWVLGNSQRYGEAADRLPSSGLAPAAKGESAGEKVEGGFSCDAGGGDDDDAGRK